MKISKQKRFDLSPLTIRRGEEFDYPTCLALYHKAFPSNERHPDEVILQRIKSGTSMLYVAETKDQFVGFALLHDLTVVPFVLLDYLAVEKDLRGKGYGSELLCFVQEKCWQRDAFLLVEAEDPDFGENQIDRIRRIHFYQRNGGCLIPKINYLLPPLDNTVPTEMKLIVFCQKNYLELSQDQLTKLLGALYEQLYKRGDKDVLFRLILQSINEAYDTN
ncbi:MAG: N-acetyltransferase [Flavobacteriia bacterium]|nr:N-acetyltransferase [Flavobacteriia bacterium]